MSNGTLVPPRMVLPLAEIRRVDDELVRLLDGLDGDAWSRPASTSWTVREVAAHLLDGNLRRLSLDRDGFVPELAPPRSGDFGDVRHFLDRLNADWIRAARRLSPAVIVELLEYTNPLVLDYFRSLDPQATAAFPVAWAGQERSPAWLDIAREYTEKWHHQHQVRAAVEAAELDDPGLLEPLLRTLVWSLPPAYRELEAAPGTTVVLRATGPVRLGWALRSDDGGWALHELEGGPAADAERCGEGDAEVRLEAGLLWRLLMRSDVEGARARAEAEGPRGLLEPLFHAVGLMV